ncbi:MAG TPA: septal ring lytic transglycosylase RlpA family protein [Gammaproteobacteria bacterium]|nr:septal ring lytic transglycosylase RlpA family protein [Gammaproteobacteria bacterium]
MSFLRLPGVLASALLLAACAEFPAGTVPTRGGDHGPAAPVDVSQVPDAVPRDVAPSRYGNLSPYTVLGKTYTLLPACQGYHERGIASWYGTQFHGGRTSDGETYDMYAMTAANKVLPIPCYVRVTNLQNGKSVIVKVNDRGPFVDNRLIDLSYAAASRIQMLGTGTALVDIEAVGPGATEPPATVGAPGGETHPLPTTATFAAAAIGTGAVTSPVVNASPQIFVQVGAFADRNNADALDRKLSAAGIGPVLVLSVADGARILYKVRVGPEPDVNAVDALTARLDALGLTDLQVVIP